MRTPFFLILACGSALWGCASRSRSTSWVGIDEPTALRMCQSDPTLGMASRLLLPGMDAYMLERSDSWFEDLGFAIAACSRGRGADFEELSIHASVHPSDWSDFIQAGWPEVGRRGAVIIRASKQGEGWSALVGNRIMISATSRRLLEECLARVDLYLTGFEETRNNTPQRAAESPTAVWVTRCVGKASITASWVRDADSVSAHINGEERQAFAEELTTKLKAVVVEETESCFNLRIPVGIDQGINQDVLHPVLIFQLLFGDFRIN